MCAGFNREVFGFSLHYSCLSLSFDYSTNASFYALAVVNLRNLFLWDMVPYGKCAMKTSSLDIWPFKMGLPSPCCIFVYLYIFYLVGWEIGASVHVHTFILDNMILYEKKISILIIIADSEWFIQTVPSYLRTINGIAGIAT